jgi:fatty-acyl-CoA synthase
VPTLASLVAHHAQRVPDREALVWDGGTSTWRELDAQVSRMASALIACGIVRGDRLMVLAESGPALFQAFFAGLRLGAIMVPANVRWAPPELRHALTDCGARAVLATPRMLSAAESAVPGDRAVEVLALGEAEGRIDVLALAQELEPTPCVEMSESDEAMIVYTSGTTGRPKAVLYTHHSAIWAALSQIVTFGLRDGERYLHIAPLHHGGGIVFFTATTILGGTHVICPGFNPSQVLRQLADARITFTLTVPTVLDFLLREPNLTEVDLSNWRAVCVGGSALPPRTLAAAFERLPHVEILQMWGQSESGPAGIYSTPEQLADRPTATGHQPEPFIEVRVVDETGADVASGGTGELLVRGEPIMPGYWQRPRETAETIRDGWLHTGDVVRVESDGSYTLVDRLKDMIISGGRNVYSIEVEQALASHPDVVDCAIIGREHPVWGETIIAVIEARPGSAPRLEEIRRHCSHYIADYKLPRDLIVAEIPRNANGKVMKPLLREAYGRQTTGALQ